MNKIKILRKNLKELEGGKFLICESVIAGVVFWYIFFIISATMLPGILLGIFIGFFLPALAVLYRSIAKIASVLYSLVWAYLGMVVLVGLRQSVPVIIFGIMVSFVAGFFVHKRILWIEQQDVILGSSAMSETPQISYHTDTVAFCPKCGGMMDSNGRCEHCNK